MKREMYDRYVERFNKGDLTVFDEYLDPTCEVWNGALHFSGNDGMKAHYAKLFPIFNEHLTILRFISDDETMAVEMFSDFTTLVDAKESPLGPASQGDHFRYHGVVMYTLRGDRFTSIKVCTLSFGLVGADGSITPRMV